MEGHRARVLSVCLMLTILILGAVAHAASELGQQGVVVDGVNVKLSYAPSTIYRLAPPAREDSMWDYYRPSGKLGISSDSDVLDGKYLKLPSGKAARITYASSDPAVVSINESGAMQFLAPGEVLISVTILETVLRVPLSVVELPIQYGASMDDLIATQGFPDTRTDRYISWPKSDFVDGVFYSPSIGHGATVKHFIYDRWPGVVIRFNALDKVNDAANIGWLDTGGLWALLESFKK